MTLGEWQDPFLTRLARRLVTIPLYFVLFGVCLTLLPALLAVAAVADLVRGGPWVLVRSVLFLQWYLFCEVVGIAFALGITVFVRDPERQIEQFFRLQCRWLRALFQGGVVCFSLRVEIEGRDAVSSGPVLVFMRHSSTADVVLPGVFLAEPHGIVLRYVLKRELLWDPCLDLAGHRLVNCFIRRGSGAPEREIAAIRRLGEDLGPDDGVLIYPEGTRFTPSKQARALERIAKSGDLQRLARARELTHVLPPRLGGPLALLEQCPDTDVVFLSHTGFDGARSLDEFFNGALVGRTVRMHFWRSPHTDIPKDAEGREAWLFDEWRKVDKFVAAHEEAPGF